MSRYLPELGLLAVVVVWGLNFAVIKVPLEVAPPYVVNVLRFVVSLTVLGALHVSDARRRGDRLLAAFDVGIWQVAGLGILGYLGYQVAFIDGVDRVSASTAALLIATSPAWTAVTAHALRHERLVAAGWIGVVVSLGGVGLVISGNPQAAFSGGSSGVVLMLCAAAAWGLYTTLSRPLLDNGATPLGLTFWGVVVAFPGLVAVALPEIGGVDWSAFGAAEIGALVFSGGLSTGLAYAIWNQSVLRAGASRTAAFSNLVPVVGVTAGVALRGDTVTVLQAIGGVLVIVGVVLVRRRGIAPAERDASGAATT
ncbi:MAG: DMT family transporter [Bacteroidota bacterium]